MADSEPSTIPKVPDHPLRSLLDDLHSPPAPPADPSASKRLHISNLPFKWREHDLEKLFVPFGAITQAEIVYNDRGSKGFGFVTFLRAEEADRAIASLSGTVILGRKIEVNEASRRRWPLADRPRMDQRHQWAQQAPLPAGHGGEPQASENIAALLLKQRQILAQQQLQQCLLSQQQSDLIATVLGLPRTALAPSLAPLCPAVMPMAQVDPTLVYQQQSLALLQQQLAVYGQVPTVPISYAVAPQLYNVAGAQSEVADPLAAPLASAIPMYRPNEAAATNKRRPGGEGCSQRFTPY